MKLISNEDITLAQEAFLEKQGWARPNQLHWIDPLIGTHHDTRVAASIAVDRVKASAQLLKPPADAVLEGRRQVKKMFLQAISDEEDDPSQDDYASWMNEQDEHPVVALYAIDDMSELLATPDGRTPKKVRNDASRIAQEGWLVGRGWLRSKFDPARSAYKYTKEDLGVTEPVFLAAAISIEEARGKNKHNPPKPLRTFSRKADQTNGSTKTQTQRAYENYLSKRSRKEHKSAERTPAPIDCIEDSLLRTAYSDYLNGMSVEQIVFHLQYACEVSISIGELNHYLDLMNEALL